MNKIGHSALSLSPITHLVRFSAVFSLMLIATLMFGCSVSKTIQISSDNPIDTASNSNATPNLENEQDNSDTAHNNNSTQIDDRDFENDKIELQSDLADNHNNSANTQMDEDEIIKNTFVKDAKIIHSAEASYTLNEPWTLKQFEDLLANEAIDWDHPGDDGAVKLYHTQKNSHGKAYLIAKPHDDSCHHEVHVYLGIRDNKNNNMVVNFYFIGDFLEYSCGTTYSGNMEFDMKPPKTVSHNGETYLQIDVITTLYEEYFCGTDEFYDSNGEYVGCEARSEESSTTYTYLYK